MQLAYANESFHNARNMSQGNRRTSRSKGASSVYQTQKGQHDEEGRGSRGSSRGQKHLKVYLRWRRRMESRKQQKAKQEKQNDFIKSFAGRVATPSGQGEQL